jgi:RNA-directed DNA polymerase
MNIYQELSDKFCLSESEARLLIYTAPVRYKVHEIPKRNGKGFRTIAQPTFEVKAVQRWLLNVIESKLPIHVCATAYRRNIGIKQHVEIHSKNRYLLKIDFSDFFPSIVATDLQNHFMRHLAVSRETAEDMSRIFCWKNKGKKNLQLAIGAPSSPTISNSILYEFDTKLTAFCSAISVCYSRYADDLAFSTNKKDVLTEVETYIAKLLSTISYPNLKVNDEKTKRLSKKVGRYITGLVITNDGEVSLGHSRKRQIRAMVHRSSQTELSEEEKEKLQGLMSFAEHIDPKFILSIERMIGLENLNRLRAKK